PAHARDRQLCVKAPDLVEHFYVSARRRARRFSNRRLIDFIHDGNLGSTRVSRVGFGVAPKQAFLKIKLGVLASHKGSPRSRDATASTRDARAPQTCSNCRE